MPDPTLQTISATQSPSLLGVSPYASKWMLYQHFANGVPLGSFEDDFIREGRRLQPFVLERAAAELRLAVHGNNADHYVRRGQLGATRDAEIMCPDRGPGALETKCVFNYQVWATEWDSGKRVPPHIEIQLQQQMLVGDGVKPFEWGVIAVWVAAAQHYFMRTPVSALWERLDREAASFLSDVEAKREPEPFGLTIEMDFLELLYPTIPHKTLDLRDDDDEMGAGFELERRARVYRACKATARTNEKVAADIRAQLIATMKDAETLLLPGNGVVRLGARRRIKVILQGAGEEVAEENDDE